MDLPIKGITDSEVKIGATKFRFEKLLALEAFEVLEDLRPGLAEAIGKQRGTTDIEQIASMVLGLPQWTVEKMRAKLFTSVTFTRKPNYVDPVRLDRDEEGAFDELEPIHVYEVLARAFAVNFFGSFSVLQSLMGAEETSPPPSTST